MTPTEHTRPQLWQLAALLADETRARFCLALLDGAETNGSAKAVS